MRYLFSLFLVFFIMSPNIVLANGYKESLTFVNKAQQYIDIDDYKEALRELDEATYHNNGYGYYGYICYLKGQIYHKLGDLEKAKDFFNKSINHGLLCKTCERGLDQPGADIQKEDILTLIESIDTVAGVTEKIAAKNSTSLPPAKKRDSHFLFLGKDDYVEIQSSFYSPYATIHPGKKEPCSLYKNQNRILENKNKKEFIKSQILTSICTVGKGEELIAHGTGWTKKVTISDFDILFKFGYEGDEIFIRGKINKLPEEPLFFSTIPIDTLENKFKKYQQIDVDQTELPKEINETIVNFPPQYKKKMLKVYSYPSADNQQFLVHFNAEGFNESMNVNFYWDLLYFVDKKTSIKLLDLKSDNYYGDCVNTISNIATLDYDGDDDFDIFIQSTLEKFVVEKRALGFHVYRFGLKPCTL